MSDPFPFQIGDRVRLNNWVPDSYVTIDWIGREVLVAHNERGEEGCYDIVTTWKKQRRYWSLYTEPVAYPEMWIAVLPNRALALTHAHSADGDPDLLGVLHLRSDGTTEMLNPNPERSNTP